jgi:hypothetical protein
MAGASFLPGPRSRARRPQAAAVASGLRPPAHSPRSRLRPASSGFPHRTASRFERRLLPDFPTPSEQRKMMFLPAPVGSDVPSDRSRPIPGHSGYVALFLPALVSASPKNLALLGERKVGGGRVRQMTGAETKPLNVRRQLLRPKDLRSTHGPSSPTTPPCAS